MRGGKVHQYVIYTLQKNIVQRDPIAVPLRPPKQSESCHRYWLCKLSIRTEMLCYKHGIIEPEAVLLYFFFNTGSLRVLHKSPPSITSTECSCGLKRFPTLFSFINFYENLD